jgi:phage terminase large subunit-like protein
LSEGACIDQADIEARLTWGAQLFDLQEICYDPWNARDLIRRVDKTLGVVCVEIRQGYATLTAPSKKLLELVATGKFYHGGHPVLKWNASCLSTRETNDNLMFRKPERGSSSLRIDGISASVNALQRAMLTGDTSYQLFFIGA